MFQLSSPLVDKGHLHMILNCAEEGGVHASEQNIDTQKATAYNSCNTIV
jgi:hypothetical protein